MTDTRIFGRLLTFVALALPVLLEGQSTRPESSGVDSQSIALQMRSDGLLVRLEIPDVASTSDCKLKIQFENQRDDVVTCTVVDSPWMPIFTASLTGTHSEQCAYSEFGAIAVSGSKDLAVVNMEFINPGCRVEWEAPLDELFKLESGRWVLKFRMEVWTGKVGTGPAKAHSFEAEGIVLSILAE